MMFKRLQAFALTAVLVLGLGGVVAADEDGKKPIPPVKPAPAKPAKWGLEKLQQQLDKLRKQVADLTEQANKDPRERDIDAYERYTAEQFKTLKKRVEVKDLVKMIFDSEAPYVTVRERAVKVIAKVNKRFADPDLTSERKGSRPSPRSAFCKKYVIKQLKNKDDGKSRALAHMLLTDLWGRTTMAGPLNYKPSKQHSATWDPAYDDWVKYLRRR